MPADESPPPTAQLHLWLRRHKAGDRAAFDDLVRVLGRRLEGLTRKLLRGFPNVRRWADTDDVMQNALLRLLRSLETIEPASMRDFYNLAAAHMRRELLDLARHFARANRHDAGPPASPGLSDARGGAEPEDRTADRGDLERWVRFHEEVEKLPAEEREAVGLIYYHGWSHAQVAELFGVSVRTVQRHWQSALVK